jgi:hypothetical protein
MRYPLKQILDICQSQPYWDEDKLRAAARREFKRMSLCRTGALGAELYISEHQLRIVFHTCKSRACPSCGFRRMMQWLRERWAALPEVPYKGITFTMPNVLWSVFRENLDLASALPALAAKVIQAWALARHGLRIGVIDILHTFNSEMDFNSHVHAMHTAGGYRFNGSWVPTVYYDRDELMKFWRNGVIGLLRAALRAGLLRTRLTMDDIERMLRQLEKLDKRRLLKNWQTAVTRVHQALTASQQTTIVMNAQHMKLMLRQEEKLWWSVKIQSFENKMQFLWYAARYAMRPPIAQRRIIHVSEQIVTFWFKNKRFKNKERRPRIDIVRCSPHEFIRRWAQHIPDKYQHVIHNFGLFAPRVLHQISEAIFAVLGQKRRSRPKSRPFADSIKRAFGYDPLHDYTGKKMRWAGRLAPNAVR